MSDLLRIGASAVNSYQTALSAIGENVANANTAGYTRRTVTLSQVGGASGGMTSNAADSFNGVTVTNVARAWNEYQAETTRGAMSDAGKASARVTWLSDTQTSMDDGATGVGQSATAFFSAANTLAADPASTTNRQQFLSALDQTASAFRSTASALQATGQGIATAAQTTVQSVNGDLDSLAKINGALLTTQPGTSAQADLMDQRDKLLDEVSGNIGITVAVAQNGTATVSLADTNIRLVGGGGAAKDGARLTLDVAGNGRIDVQAVSNGSAVAVADAGGALGGMTESAGVVADRRTSVDTLANGFAASINGFQAAGTDQNGAAGQPLLTTTGAAGLTLTTSDPSKIAAASGSGANGNLLTLSSLRGTGGVEARWTSMTTDQGQLVATATAQSSAASARSDAATSTRDQASGVDLDTEAAELLRYQQAYSGAAKVIQTANETLQSILALF